MKRLISGVLAIILVLSLFPFFSIEKVSATGNGLGPVQISGGKRDFTWPLKNGYGISSCFYDGRGHYAIDIVGGSEVVAAYDGVVEEITWNDGTTDGGYGNAVMLKHTYAPSRGEPITLYTRYAHMASISVYEGQPVKAGDTLGIAGGTGYGSTTAYHVHLDFQVLTSPNWRNRSTCSIDPFANDLLPEIPISLSGYIAGHIYVASTKDCCGVGPTGCCCFHYMESVKAQYSIPIHTHKWDSAGFCSDPNCRQSNWIDTLTHDYDGIYVLLDAVYPSVNGPYSSDKTKAGKLKKGTEVNVCGRYTNSYGNNWYMVSLDNRSCYGFVYSEHLKRKNTGSTAPSSNIKVNITWPAEGQTIPKKSTNILGVVNSSARISEIKGYLDGAYVSTDIPNESNCYSFQLKRSKLDYALPFNSLGSGRHTIRLEVKDITGNTKSFTRIFYTELSACAAATITTENVIGGKYVTMSCPGASLRYSTSDGRTGTGTDNVRIHVAKTTEITVTTSKSGFSDNQIQRTIAIEQTPLPFISSKEWYGGTNVTITSEPGADIYYYFEGTQHGQYVGTFNVTSPATVFAYAIAPGCSQSKTAKFEVTETKPSTPIVSLLDTAQHIPVGKNAVFQWQQNSRAQEYTVNVYKDGVKIETITQSENVYSRKLDAAGKYEVSVVATNPIGSSSESEKVVCYAMDPLNVRFEDDDGTLLAEYTVEYGSYLKKQTNPSHKGHYFSGWTPTNNYYSNPVTTDATYTATYSPIEYTVTFYDVDGIKFGDTQRVCYQESAELPDYSENVPVGYVFTGWTVIEASDQNSLCDYTCVDANLKLQAVVRWANEELPVCAQITSAKVTNVDNDSQYEVDVSLTNWPNATSNVYVCLALKSKDNATGVYKTAFATKVEKNLAAGATIPLHVDLTYSGIAESVEVVVLERKDNDTTGSAYSLSVTKPVVFSSTWTEWSNWSTQAPENADGRYIENKTQYRYQTKETMTSSSSSVDGWTLSGSTWTWSDYGAWSGWSDTLVTASDSVKVETRQVEVSPATTTYTYGAYFSNNSSKPYAWTHFCPTCAINAYGGTWYYKTYTQNSRASVISFGQSCGHMGSFPYEYRAADGYLYYYETVNTAPATYKTQYRYATRSKIYTYSFYRWTSWSAWSDTAVTATASRNVETRVVYRFRDAVPLYSSSAGAADVSGTVYSFTGTIETELDLSGKVATIMVYQSKNMDPNQYQMQFIGQTYITNGNQYSVSFIPIREPTVESGNYVVSLGVQGTTGLINVNVVEAPKETFTVRFLDEDGTLLSTQSVQDGDNAVPPEIPLKEGKAFSGWSMRTTDIYKNCDIYAKYDYEKYTVTYVDWINCTLGFQTYYYGETLEVPMEPSAEGHVFLGWDAVLNENTTVTGNMVVTAVYDAQTFEVRFYNENAEVIETQIVEYGGAATLPVPLEIEGRVFYGWSTDCVWWNVKENIDVHPLVGFEETTTAPMSNQSSVVTSTEAVFDLFSEDGATIYYTLDGTIPSIYSTKYEAPIHVEQTTHIKAIAVVDGKNDSAISCFSFYYDDAPSAYEPEETILLDELSVHAESGKALPIQVSIADNPGLVYYSLVVEFDQSVFFLDADNQLCYTPTALTDFGDFVVSPFGTTGWVITWMSSTPCTKNGVLFTLPVRAGDEIEIGDYTVSLSYIARSAYTADIEEATLESDRLSLAELDEDSLAYLTVADVASNGLTATVPVTADNLSTVSTASIPLVFDTTVLELTAAYTTDGRVLPFSATETGALVTIDSELAVGDGKALFNLDFNILDGGNQGVYFVSIDAGKTGLTSGTDLPFVIATSGSIVYEGEPVPIPDENLKIKTASISLQSDISINFYVADSVLEGWTDPYMVFTKALYDPEGNITGYTTETVTDFDLKTTADGTACHVYRFAGITSVEMGSAVTATLFATKNEIVYEGKTVNYSVATYATNQLKKTSDPKLQTLLVDLLNYGSAAQTYWNHNTANLVNANLTDAQQAFSTAENPSLVNYRELVKNEGATVSFKTCSLSLEEKVTVNYYLNLNAYTGDLNDLEVHVSYTDTDGSSKTVVIDSSKFEYKHHTDGNYYYVANFSGLNAIQMRTICTAGVFSKASGERISHTVIYSIESYAQSKSTAADAGLVNLVYAMMKYGDSTRRYFLPDITISFDANGGSVTPTEIVAIPGQPIGELPIATRDGYGFDGWFTATDGGDEVTAETVYYNSVPVTLFAHWNASQYSVSWSPIGNCTVSVERTASPSGKGTIGALQSGDSVYYGDELSVSYNASTGYHVTSHGDDSITVIGVVTANDIYATVAPNEYTVNWSDVSNCSIVVSRTASLKEDASIGTLAKDAAIYYGDTLSVTYQAATGYTLGAHGSNSITVAGNITSSDIYATVTLNTYTASWSNGTGYSIAVSRTASPYAGASTGSISSGATVYYGDVLNITYTAATGYTITNKGATSITVTENVTSSQIWAQTTVNSYTVSWNAGTNCTITVKRTSSPKAGAATGTLSSGAIVYYSDVLSVTYTAATGYSISTHGSTSITVTGNVTSSSIYATATANSYTYNIIYKSSNGTSLGSATATYKYGTTNTITPPAKSGYTTPASQTVAWNSTSPKTITFTYTPVSVSNQTITSGTWTSWGSGKHGISYNVRVEYGTRTSTGVQMRIVWTNTVFTTSYLYYGYGQYFTGVIGGQSTGQVQIASASTWASTTYNGASSTGTSGWITVPVSATSTSTSISLSWNDQDGVSGSWSGTVSVPTY